jgi:hypothetical protein
LGNNGLIKNCSDPNCHINFNESSKAFDFNCGNCTNTTNKCAQCNNSLLCNTEEFFEKKLFCFEKKENTLEKIKGIRVCENECFVYRNESGNGMRE